MTTRLAIATYDPLPDLTDEDRILARALAPLGVECVPWVWNAARPDGIDAVLARSCWDYHLHTRAFVDWIARLERDGTPLANPAATIRWNMHKGYLLELAERGVAVPETRLVRATDDAADAVASMPAGPLVVKPAVSMSGWETYRVDARARSEATERVRALLQHGDVLVQAYRPEIGDGEISIVFFGGEPSHAVRKRPAPGEFRVQSDFGGSREPIVAEPAWIAAARRTLSFAPSETLVARVDGVVVDGALVLMELEAIDPEVYLERVPEEATRRFARVIRAWLDGAMDAGA